MKKSVQLLLGSLLMVSVSGAQAVPQDPSKPMVIAVPAPLRPAEAELDAKRTYSLPELIDFAEAHNPQTRVAWERAKQQANRLGIARAALYPSVAVAALAQQTRARVLFGNEFFRQDLTALQPVLSVYYTLFDFGARRAAIGAAQAELLASDLAFNDTHRRLIYAVSAAFYRVDSALAQVDAAQATLNNAQTVQAAVEARLSNGLGTLPDVLEAHAATAQASYELETVRGLQRLAHGQLTEALGVRPTADVQVQTLAGLSPPALSESVTAFIDRALAHRPDLLAQAAQLKAADAAIRSARAQYFPKVTFNGNANEQFQYGVQPPNPYVSVDGETWLAQLSASWTLFDGRARYNEQDRARSERRQVQAEIATTQDHIANEVWAAYSDVQTSLQRQEAARALLSAAEQSYDAALEAYRYGVKNFLDVVSAQRTLAQARTAQVQSQAEVLTNFAQLAFTTGDLAPTPRTTGGHP